MRPNKHVSRWQPHWLAGDETARNEQFSPSRQNSEPADADLLDAYSAGRYGPLGRE